MIALLLLAGSGLQPGVAVPAFRATAVTGAQAGKVVDALPKTRASVQVWASGGASFAMRGIARTLDDAVARDDRLSAIVVFVRPKATPAPAFAKALADRAKGLDHVRLYTLDGPGAAPLRAYRISTARDVESTVMVTREGKVIANFINLSGGLNGASRLERAIRQALGQALAK